MENPSELSLAEIRNYMLLNNYKVTNHSLVKHFKRFLTNPETQNEARKQFKTYVNILATIKNENNQKFLILREKYFNECPSEDVVNPMEAPMSPGATSIISDGSNSPLRRPPPYKPPPEVSPTAVKVPILQEETKDNYRDCISEFQAAISHIDSNRVVNQEEPEKCAPPPTVPPRKRASTDRSVSRESSVDDNKENVSVEISSKEVDSSDKNILDSENQISVKEVTKKFNRMASEEEAKVISPSSKKKPEVIVSEDKMTTDDQVEEKATPDVTLSHPEARKWIVSAAKSDYQELAKLASKHPELVKLQDPTTGTALHWAAKHGNENVVKLIAGTYKANVNARTNGGYTPLHLAVQYGKDDIFELLCNVYKANRDLTDWSGNKPLDYSKQSTTVSASTYSKIKARRKHSEKDLGFLRIGSLNVRVKKTTEAFSNFLGVGGGSSSGNSTNLHHHHPQHSGMTQRMTTTNRLQAHQRTSAPPTSKHFDKLKSWGSADNIPQDSGNMPPPKNISIKKHRSKRKSDYDVTGYNSMPTTPNQLRAPIGILSENPKGEAGIDSDSDSACGFGSHWSVGRTNNDNIAQKPQQFM